MDLQEMDVNLRDSYRGKRVLVTGNTGFKGSWLSEWLLSMGAEVYGYALEPPTEPSLFEQLGLRSRVSHFHGDIREPEHFARCYREACPDIVFHMAAQSQVRESFARPLETAAVNTLGTAHVLEAARLAQHPVVLIMVTSDKCYQNCEWEFGYREEDRLGGQDVYSASKASAEILIEAWRSSFFPPGFVAEHGVWLASVRAGNVVGGGDWARHRIVPDCIRALMEGQPIVLRSPEAVRPWQHVLDPLSGYLVLGARLMDPQRPVAEKTSLATAFNFGPTPASTRTVRELTERVLHQWGEGAWKNEPASGRIHEANNLRLAIDRAHRRLDWVPRWGFEVAVERTVDWYRDVAYGIRTAYQATGAQILEYEAGLYARQS
mgnify:CR=1 FL=1